MPERPLLSAVFRVVRARNRTIESLHREIARQRKANGRLGSKIKALRAQRARLQARIAQLCSSRAVLSKAVFGEQEREAGDAALGAQTRPAARARPVTAVPLGLRSRRRRNGRSRRRTRSYVPAAASPMSPTASVPRRSSRSRSSAHVRRIVRPALPPGLRLPVLAPGGDPRPPAGAAVRRNALRDQRLGAHPLRALCLLPAPASGRGVDDRPGVGDRAGDAGEQRAALPAAVRTARRGDPRLPERDGGAPRRRDRLAHPGTERDRPLAARVAVDIGRQGCRLLPHRPLAQRRGRDEAVRFGQGHGVPGLRPLQRLHQDGARTRRQGDPVLVLGPPEARLHRVRRRPGEAEAVVRGVDRAVRVGRPAEQGAAEASRPPLSNARRRRSTPRRPR